MGSSTLLPPGVADTLHSVSIKSLIQGFQITEFPLCQLGCLLGETYIEEDVLNALSELLYFLEATRNWSPTIDPSFLFLPTLFLNN